MIRMFCVLGNVGGISGNRIYVKRINCLRHVINNYGNEPEDFYKIYLNKKQDTLKCKDLNLLDKFFLLLNRQTPIINYEQVNTHFEPAQYICILEYLNGEVIRLGMVTIEQIIRFFDKYENNRVIMLNEILSFNREINFEPDIDYPDPENWAYLVIKKDEDEKLIEEKTFDIDRFTAQNLTDGERRKARKIKGIISKLSEKNKEIDLITLKKKSYFVRSNEFKKILETFLKDGSIFNVKEGFVQII